MKAYKVVVTDTVTQLVPRDNINRPVWLQIEGNNTVYIGGSDVTSAQGFPIAKHAAPIEGGLPVGDGLWGICAAGQSETIRIITIDAD
jgi:hypothetical protein